MMMPCSCEENTRPSTGSSRNSEPLARAGSALVTSTVDVSSRDGKTHTTRTKANPKSQICHVSRLVLSPLQFPLSFPCKLNPVYRYCKCWTAGLEHWEPGFLSQNSLALCTITPSLIFVMPLYGVGRSSVTIELKQGPDIISTSMHISIQTMMAPSPTPSPLLLHCSRNTDAYPVGVILFTSPSVVMWVMLPQDDMRGILLVSKASVETLDVGSYPVDVQLFTHACALVQLY